MPSTQRPTWASWLCFFFNDTPTTEIYTLSLHDALPISHANTGLSETSSTELATDVNRSDAIHVQKCAARSSPESSIWGNASRTARVRCRSRVASPNVTGSTSTSRQNAIATAGAAANRTIGPAYVVARTATMRTTSGDMGGGNLMERRAIVSPELPSLLVGLTFGRPMRLRLALCVAMACIVSALTGGGLLSAQEASPYLPLPHRGVPDVEPP